MANSTLLRASGLYTFPNHLSSVPTGALLKADNVVINKENIAESRRGFKLYGTVMGTDLTAHQLLAYKGRMFRHFGASTGTTLEYDSDGAGTFSEFKVIISGITNSTTTVTFGSTLSTSQLEAGMRVSGSGVVAGTTIASITDNLTIVLSVATTTSIPGPGGTPLTFTYDISEVELGRRIRSVEQNGNFYFTSSEGIKKISAANAAGLSSATITPAGGIKALDLELALNAGTGFFTDASVVGYRVLWGIKDTNNNLILGTPSARTIIRNASGSTKTVDVTITIPRGVTTAHFYQIYRTAVVADPSGDQDPGDEQQLVYEANPTNAQLTAGTITTTDITPESFRVGGAYLYTNQNSGEGILQANDIPPLAKDITSFKGYTFYANTQTLQRLNFSLLSVANFTKPYAAGSGPITNTVANPTVVTSANHGLTTGRTITISGSNSTPSINGSRVVTVINANTFSVPVNVTIAGTAGTWVTSDTPDTFTVTDGTTTTAYTFAVVEDAANKRVAVSTAATPAQQVDETARSLIRVINKQDSEIVYGYYLSGPSDVPGLMLLEGRSLSQAAFYLNVNAAATTGIEFSPALPASGNSVISTNEVLPNRIYYSKFQQPEAVPILNYIDVGPQDKAIQRVLALRDNLFILKEDGVYRLSGLTTPFTVYPFDFSVIIKAPDSAVVLNNLIYLYCNQGIGTVSDTGVEVISRPIEDDIVKLLISNYTHFGTATFGVPYESDRSYYLFTVTETSDTYATQCFRYNTFTKTWTKADFQKRCGLVNPANDLMYLGPNDTDYIEIERKIFDRTDFSDREVALTLGASAVDGTSIAVPSVTNISAGDVLVQTQYLTISKFNQLLSKLDRDAVLTYGQYVTNFSASAGANLSDSLDGLIAAIATDAGRVAAAGSTAAGTYTALTPTPSTFVGQQNTYNSLVNLLNADTGTGYKNYRLSANTTNFEFNILSIDSDLNTITSAYTYPLLEGPVVIYNHITVELQWVPQYLQDVSMTKHVSEGTLIFEDSSFSEAIITYATDLSADVEQQSIEGSGNGIFGNNTFGNGLYGGSGSGVPFRTYVPREKARCRYINVGFIHSVAREIFSLYGLSLTSNPISQRGWR